METSCERPSQLTIIVHQGKEEISAMQIEDTNKAIVATDNDPLLLRGDDHLQYNVDSDGMGESTFELHTRKGIKINSVVQVGYQQPLAIQYGTAAKWPSAQSMTDFRKCLHSGWDLLHPF